MLANLWNDLRYAARRLTASPGFTAAAVATIALGVGVNTSIFSVMNGLLLRDLPAPDADELVSIHQLFDETTMRQRSRSGGVSDFSTSEYRRYRDGTRTLSGIMGYSRVGPGVTLGGDVPREIAGTFVTCNYFDVLRQIPALGAGFGDNCDAEGSSATVVLGHDLWTSAFGADPAIIGRTIILNRQPFTVVGVAPEGMRGVDMQPASYFAPISTQPLLNPSSTVYRAEWSWLTLIGRRADDTRLDEVRAELGMIAARIDAEQSPRRTMLVVARARPSSPEDRAEALPTIIVVMTAFGLVLLIACANVANLLLARATGRSREIAVRVSLGASRARVVQQLLVESLVIAVIGGTLGALVAIWSAQGVVALALSALPPDVPSLMIDAGADGRVLAFAVVLTLGSSALFGLAPALHSSKPDLHAAMKTDIGGMGRRAGRLQGTLLAGQVAISMVLMISAGLLLRGLYATQTVEPGFTYEDVAVASFDLSSAGYDAARAVAFQRQLAERVGSLPGIAGVAHVMTTPLTMGGGGFMARLPGQQQQLLISFNAVSANYFSLLGLPIVRGRTFTDAEITVASGGFTGSGVMIVTEATARRFWPDQDPLGQTLIFGETPVQVVGVAKDAEITRIGGVPSDYAYFPADEAVQGRGRLQLLAKSRIDVAATFPCKQPACS